MVQFVDIINYFKKYDNFLITCHESPDGDALAAEYALAVGLKNLNKNVRIINSDETPEKYFFIDEKNLIKQFKSDQDLPQNLNDWTLVVVDTELSNTGHLEKLIEDKIGNIMIIDHHNYDDLDLPMVYLNPEAGSTCEIIFEILVALQTPIEKDIALALYTGIIYDTGSFAYPKTTAETFRIAEQLVRSGVVPNHVYSRLYESKSVESIILQTLVHGNMNFYFEKRVAVQYMSKETLLTSKAHYEEAQEIVNFPLQSKRVRVSVFFKENEEGLLRCSIRSKGRVNCVNIARLFNGGGHKTAAGFKCYDTFEIMEQRVLDILHDYFT